MLQLWTANLSYVAKGGLLRSRRGRNFAYETYIRASHAESRHQEKVEQAEWAAGRTRPVALVAWRDYSHIGGAEIERARDEYLAAGCNPKTIAREYQDVRANYAAKIKAEEEWKEATGLAPLIEAREMAAAIEIEAALTLASVMPTTLSGVSALLAYIDAFNHGEFGRIDEGWYSSEEQWPNGLVDDEAPVNPRGNPVELDFGFSVIRSLRQALQSIAAAA